MYTLEHTQATEGSLPTVRIITDDDAILEDGDAMDAVCHYARRIFGPAATLDDYGCSFQRGGREIGWEWDVVKGGAK